MKDDEGEKRNQHDAHNKLTTDCGSEEELCISRVCYRIDKLKGEQD